MVANTCCKLSLHILNRTCIRWMSPNLASDCEWKSETPFRSDFANHPDQLDPDWNPQPAWSRDCIPCAKRDVEWEIAGNRYDTAVGKSKNYTPNQVGFTWIMATCYMLLWYWIFSFREPISGLFLMIPGCDTCCLDDQLPISTHPQLGMHLGLDAAWGWLFWGDMPFQHLWRPGCQAEMVVMPLASMPFHILSLFVHITCMCCQTTSSEVSGLRTISADMPNNQTWMIPPDVWRQVLRNGALMFVHHKVRSKPVAKRSLFQMAQPGSEEGSWPQPSLAKVSQTTSIGLRRAEFQSRRNLTLLNPIDVVCETFEAILIFQIFTVEVIIAALVLPWFIVLKNPVGDR